MLRILLVGDIVGEIGVNHLRKVLPKLKREKGIDFVIANGENASNGNGITPSSAEDIFVSGADVITLGNHTYRRPEFHDYIDTHEAIIRPANFSTSAPGNGYYVADMGRVQICVINLIGQSFMDNYDNPFDKLDEILKKEGLPKIKIVDFHAEATGEKKALGYYADGRVTALFGTHTHVQTADECILPNGTAYITDVGMTGPVESVLGVKPELVIKKLRTRLPVRFDYAEGKAEMGAMLIDCDEKSGKSISVERIKI